MTSDLVYTIRHPGVTTDQTWKVLSVRDIRPKQLLLCYPPVKKKKKLGGADSPIFSFFFLIVHCFVPISGGKPKPKLMVKHKYIIVTILVHSHQIAREENHWREKWEINKKFWIVPCSKLLHLAKWQGCIIWKPISNKLLHNFAIKVCFTIFTHPPSSLNSEYP